MLTCFGDIGLKNAILSNKSSRFARTFETVLDSNCRCSSDVVLEEYNVVLRCVKCWVLRDDHDDTYDVRCIAREGSG